MNGRGAYRAIAALAALNLVVGVLAASAHSDHRVKVTSTASPRGSATGEPTTTAASVGVTDTTATSSDVDSMQSSGGPPPSTTAGSVPDATASTGSGDDSGPMPSTTVAHAPPPTDPPAAPACHNSHDPACGDFSWSPDPDNSPVEWQVTSDPQQPQAGQPVTFYVTVTDHESRVLVGNECYGDHGCLARTDFYEASPIGYGPWTPPMHP